MTVCMIEYTAVPYIGQRRCSRYRFRLFDRFFFYRLSKAHSGTAAVLVDELDAGGGVLASRCSQKGARLGSFRKTSPPVLTASALSASEAERLVRHRSRR